MKRSEQVTDFKVKGNTFYNETYTVDMKIINVSFCFPFRSVMSTFRSGTR